MGKALLFEPPYRNPSEKFLGHLLETAGVPFAYEAKKLEYSVPARTAKYLPDFCITGTNILLEYKGWFGRNGAKERQKLLLLKQQHPNLDIRLVFSNAKNKIYTGSPTTYAAWADENGFKWCEVNKARGRTTLPASWVKDMKPASKGKR
jgi:hypothetical protein